MGGHSSRTANCPKQPLPDRRAICTGYGVLLFHITRYEVAEIVRIHNAVNAMDRSARRQIALLLGLCFFSTPSVHIDPHEPDLGPSIGRSGNREKAVLNPMKYHADRTRRARARLWQWPRFCYREWMFKSEFETVGFRCNGIGRRL